MKSPLLCFDVPLSFCDVSSSLLVKNRRNVQKAMNCRRNKIYIVFVYVRERERWQEKYRLGLLSHFTISPKYFRVTK